MVKRLDGSSTDFEQVFADFLNIKRDAEIDVDQIAADIIAAIRERGDEALCDYTTKLDRFSVTPETLAISAGEIENACNSVDRDQLAALELAATRIRDYHQKQLPEDLDYEDAAGMRLGYRWTPIQAVGLYVPGGTASYPSSVLMNALPAKVAGVERLAMVVPTPDGELNPLVLAAAKIAGVNEIYRIGGAQAVAALAYGTQTIAPVDKIVGPGNAYVAAAKRRVFGVVGIDMIAGPSEILVVADSQNDPTWIAADLMSQAEHDTSAQAILIADDAGFADLVVKAVEDCLQELPRADIARESWQQYGAVIVAARTEIAGLVNRIAPEHLELAVEDADELAGQIKHAGAIFLGRYTPEALGDYVAGPNHVLPTSKSARFSSGLGVLDFLKRSSIIEADRASINAIGPAAVTLAQAEGLDAHALSVSLRLKGDGDG